MADNQLVPPPDFHPSEPQLGVLYPEGPSPLQELPDPGQLPPPQPNQSADFSIADTLSRNDFQSVASKTFDPNYLVQPTRYNDESYDRLQKTFDNPERDNLFSKVGFRPGINNEDRFSTSLSKWQKVGLAWDQMWGLAKETFAQQWSTEGQFWGSLATGSIKQAFLPFDNKEELESMSRTMENTTLSNYIPLNYEEQTGHFGFGKFATGLGQFGFTLGTIGAFGTQLVLEMTAAALLAPETEGSSLVIAAAGATNKARKLHTLTEFYRDLSRLENTTERANKIKQAWQYMTKTENIKAGLGNFYSFTKQWNAAAGEAKFEAGSSYTEYIDNKYKKARDEGRFITFSERQKIEEDAANVATHNGMVNTGLLFIMNRINMGNVFKGPFAAQRRFLIELGEGADDALIKTAKGWVPKASVKGMFSKEGAMGLGKGLIGWTTDSAWEGVQEVAQGISNKYWQTYYGEQYNRDANFNMMSLIGKSIAARLDSNESFDEFVSGFIIGIPGSAINMGMGKLYRNVITREQTKQYKEQVTNLANELNKWEQAPERVFDVRVANVNNQIMFSQEMQEAIKTNNIYAYKNLNHQAMRDMIMLGIRTGKLDYMIDTLKDQIQNLKPEEFEALFKVTADSTNKKSAADYVNLLEQQADGLVKEYDKSKQKFANPYTNFSKFKPGSQEETDARIKYVAWENAVQDLVFQKDTYKHVVKRMGDILSDVNTEIGSALYNPFFTLTSTENIAREISMLNEEIKSIKLNPTLDTTAQQLLTQKEAQLKGLKRWSDSHSLIGSFLEKREDFVASLAQHTDEARAAFTEALQAYQTTTLNAEPLTTDQIDKAYQGIIDYARLNNDNKVAVRNISLLASPEGFSDHFDRHYIKAQEFYKQELERRYDKVIQRNKLNAVLEFDDMLVDELPLVGAEEEKTLMFSRQPIVRTLRARIEQAIEDRDFDGIEKLYDELQVEYDKFYKPTPATPAVDEEKVHTVVKQADGKFTVMSPEGKVVQSDIDTEDKANEIAKNLDEALATAAPVAPVPIVPTPGPVPPTPPAEPAILRVYKNRIAKTSDVNVLNKISADIDRDGLKKGLTADHITELQQMIQDRIEEIAKNKGKVEVEEQKTIDDFRELAEKSFTEDDKQNLIKAFWNIANSFTLTPEGAKQLEKIFQDRVQGINDGTIKPPAKITKDEMVDKIKNSDKDNILAIKKEVEKEFTGVDKDDLLSQVIDKMNKFAEEQKEEEEMKLNNTFDTSNIDSFNADDVKDDLDEFASTVEEKPEEKPETKPEPNVDQAADDLFNSCG